MTHYLFTATLLSLALTSAIVGAQPADPSDGTGKGRFLGLQQALETGLQNHPIVQEGNAGLLASSARRRRSTGWCWARCWA